MAATGFPDLTYSGLVSATTRQELEALVSLIQGYLGENHKSDGTHSDIVAETCASAGGYHEYGRLQPLGSGETIRFDPTMYTAVAPTTWDMTSTNQSTFLAARVGNMLWVCASFVNFNVSVAGSTALYLLLPYGLMASANTSTTMIYSDAGAPAAVGVVECTTDSDKLTLTNFIGGWTVTAANNSTITFSGWFPVKSST